MINYEPEMRGLTRSLMRSYIHNAQTLINALTQRAVLVT